MGIAPYIKPELTEHGSVVSLTLGKPGSDIDGASGMQGNASNSDNTGGGKNGGPPNPMMRRRRRRR